MRCQIIDAQGKPVDEFPSRCKIASRVGWSRQVAWAGIALGLLGGLGSPAFGSDSVDETLRRFTGDAFRVYNTEHFRIAYDTSIETLQSLADRIEGTYHAVSRFCDAMQIETEPAAGPFGIVVFARYEDYMAFLKRTGLAGTSTSGIYDPTTKLAAFCHAPDTPLLRPLSNQIVELTRRLEEVSEERDQNRSSQRQQERLRLALSELRNLRATLARRFDRFVVQHEVAHQVLFGYGLHVEGASEPAFLVEGLACQFETGSTSTQPWRPKVNQSRLADLREAIGATRGAQGFSLNDRKRLMETGRIVPLSVLLSQSAVMDSTGEFARYRYAQAWGLVYDLIRHQPETFGRYLRSRRASNIRHRPDARGSLGVFEDFFGKVDSGFDLAWFHRMLSLRFDPLGSGP